MKKNVLSTLAVLGLLGGLLGCKKDPENPGEPITATFQVLNEQGQETAVFAAGQNVVFRYEVRNTTDREIDIKAPIYDGAAFLEVFDKASGQSVGTPYEGLCTSYRRYFVVPARGTLTFTVPWVAAAQYPTQEPFCTHAATT